MAARRGDGHRLIRWLWTSRRVDAKLARAGLAPLSALWRLGIGARLIIVSGSRNRSAKGKQQR